MPFKPGDKKPANSGRQKGTPNKDTQNLHDIANEMGVNPFKILLQFASGDEKTLKLAHGDITPELRQKAAKDACEYLFPKLKSVEHKGLNAADLFSKMLEEVDGSRKP